MGRGTIGGKRGTTGSKNDGKLTVKLSDEFKVEIEKATGKNSKNTYNVTTYTNISGRQWVKVDTERYSKEAAEYDFNVKLK